MKSIRSKAAGLTACLALAMAALTSVSYADQDNFRVFSSEFSNGSMLPYSTVLNEPGSNGQNTCTANGTAGGDTSPQLSWSGAPAGTRSYVVVLYDVTASFTHWGMYNISGDANGLPANAGIANSQYGQQVENDFALGEEYDGPCPPAGYTPTAHQYVFTVYALCTRLELPNNGPNFPPNGEALYHALITAGEHGQILAQASIVTYFSSTPGTPYSGTPVTQ
jgi:Raf kinase inhibitor-like YbhB/YbcL family protein